MLSLSFFRSLSTILGVQSAAVNVVCELARKNPKNYLPLAPVFFKLMTTSTNNWMLIKIIKLVSFYVFDFLIYYTCCYYFVQLFFGSICNTKCYFVVLKKGLNIYNVFFNSSNMNELILLQQQQQQQLFIKYEFLFLYFILSPGYFPHSDYQPPQPPKFASLTTIEPALGRKLTQPLIEIISRFNKVFFNSLSLSFS